MTKNSRSAFSLIELLCVIAIVSMMIGMLMPSIQAARESARSITCRNHLRNLGLAVTQYEGAVGRLPPGTMSFNALPVHENGGRSTYYQYADNPDFEFYWKKTQNTSWLGYVLEFIEMKDLSQSFPTGAFAVGTRHWCAIDDQSVREAIQIHLPIAYCPSDNLRDDIKNFQMVAVVRAQNALATSPGIVTPTGEPDGFFYEADPVIPDLTGNFAGTNYIGCCGAYATESHPQVRPVGYSGALINGHGIRMARITDGQSNTVLIGESLGEVEQGGRKSAFVWAYGGVGCGRGGTGWLETLRGPEYFLGDSKYSNRHGFGSYHPTTVNVAFVDGSVHAIYRGISVEVWYSLCGRADGNVIPMGDY
jgi:prepilin-type N-terminal cleavage/methylation domain-containing protein/prepilin-type processing-associated H-X9-DG protein